MDINLLTAAFLALGIALSFLGLDLVVSSRNVALKDRIGTFATLPKKPVEQASEPGAKTPRKLPIAELNRRLATQLARADLPITPSEYAVATLGISLAPLVLFGLLGSLVIGLVGFLVGLIGPWMYVRYLQQKRLQAFDGELEGAITMLSNNLRSGSGLLQAMDSVAKEFAPPLSTELGRVVREVSLGLALNDALASLVRRNASLDLEMIVTAINVNHDIGGNLAEVLDRISQTIRDRVRIAGEVRAITAQQRLSAIVLIGLPFAVTLIVYVMNPDYIALLWQNSCGLAMIGVGVVMLMVGIVVIRRILVLKY